MADVNLLSIFPVLLCNTSVQSNLGMTMKDNDASKKHGSFSFDIGL